MEDVKLVYQTVLVQYALMDFICQVVNAYHVTPHAKLAILTHLVPVAPKVTG